MKRLFFACFLLLLAFSFCSASTAINTCQGLQDINSNLVEDYYLDANVDCSGFAFQPIGNYNQCMCATALCTNATCQATASACVTTCSGSWQPERAFQGTLDGNGYFVNNLSLDTNKYLYVGIFSDINSTGSIKNLGITNTMVRNFPYIAVTNLAGGILSGRATNTKDFNSIQIYDSNITDFGIVGGITGYSIGTKTIRDSKVVISILNTSLSSGTMGAGFAGSSTTINCYRSYANVTVKPTFTGWTYGLSSMFSGTSQQGSNIVECKGNLVADIIRGSRTKGYGGLTATISGDINNSYSTGTITMLSTGIAGDFFVGGLAGTATTTNKIIFNSFSLLDVNLGFGNTAKASVLGGLVGVITPPVYRITNSFNWGQILDVNRAFFGGIDGNYVTAPTVSNVFWRNDYSGAPSNCIEDNNTGCTEGTSASYFYDKTNAPLSSWDFENIWFSDETNTSYPVLRWETNQSWVNFAVKDYLGNDINNWNLDCNVDDYDASDKNTIYRNAFTRASYSCIFSKTGYDSNTSIFVVPYEDLDVNVTLHKEIQIDFNVYEAETSTHLTGVDVDCNVNAFDLSNQSSPFSMITTDGTSLSCEFSKTGYDSNTFEFVFDSNKTIIIYLTLIPPITINSIIINEELNLDGINYDLNANISGATTATYKCYSGTGDGSGCSSNSWDCHTGSLINNSGDNWGAVVSATTKDTNGTWTCKVTADSTNDTNTAVMNELTGIVIDATTGTYSGNPDSTNNAILTNESKAYLIITHNGNINLNLSATGNNFTFNSNTISLENQKWYLTNDAGSSIPFTGSADTIKTNFAKGTYPTSATQNLYLWLNIPANKASGAYDSTIILGSEKS